MLSSPSREDSSSSSIGGGGAYDARTRKDVVSSSRHVSKMFQSDLQEEDLEDDDVIMSNTSSTVLSPNATQYGNASTAGQHFNSNRSLNNNNHNNNNNVTRKSSSSVESDFLHQQHQKNVASGDDDATDSDDHIAYQNRNVQQQRFPLTNTHNNNNSSSVNLVASGKHSNSNNRSQFKHSPSASVGTDISEISGIDAGDFVGVEEEYVEVEVDEDGNEIVVSSDEGNKDNIKERNGVELVNGNPLHVKRQHEPADQEEQHVKDDIMPSEKYVSPKKGGGCC